MPAIYEGLCPACDHRELMADHVLAIRFGDGDEHHLGHPVDTAELEALGLTWDEADDRGLFVHYAGAVCGQCARVTLHDSGGHQSLVGHNGLDRMVAIGGCAGALSGAGLGFLWGLDSAVSWWAKIIVAPVYLVIGGMIGAALGAGLGTIFERLVCAFLPRLSANRDTAECPSCFEGKLHTLRRAADLELFCPSCGDAEYRIKMTGVA